MKRIAAAVALVAVSVLGLQGPADAGTKKPTPVVQQAIDWD